MESEIGILFIMRIFSFRGHFLFSGNAEEKIFTGWQKESTVCFGSLQLSDHQDQEQVRNYAQNTHNDTHLNSLTQEEHHASFIQDDSSSQIRSKKVWLQLNVYRGPARTHLNKHSHSHIKHAHMLTGTLVVLRNSCLSIIQMRLGL